MPIPFLLAGVGVAAGIIGAGGHLSAKETNEKAQRISCDAQNLYNKAKVSLESAQNKTEKSLLKLGYSKKNILDTSMKQFLKSYDKVKNFVWKESVGLNEISNFTIDQQDAMQLRKLSDIYSASVKNGAAGAAAGAIVALAVSGDLAIVTSGLSAAGAVLATGEIGAAVGIAGSALSLGAAMTPLAAVAAPVVLFTGISASMKADENLEKARTMYAEAEAASEKMKVSEILCEAISERSEMYDNVLEELNGMFSRCSSLLDVVIKKKEGRFFKKRLTSEDLSEDDLKLIAVTRSLAGAIKAILDTPILTKEGDITYESQEIYDKTVNKLPDFNKAVAEVETMDYNVKTVQMQSSNRPVNSQHASLNDTYNFPGILQFVMWILAIWVIVGGIGLIFSGSIIAGMLSVIGGLIMCPGTNKTMNFLPRLGLMFFLLIIRGFFL